MVFASGINWGTAPNASVFTSDIGSDTRLATSGEFAAYLTEQIIEKSNPKEFDLESNEEQLAENIKVIYNQMVTSKIEWWKF